MELSRDFTFKIWVQNAFLFLVFLYEYFAGVKFNEKYFLFDFSPAALSTKLFEAAAASINVIH